MHYVCSDIHGQKALWDRLLRELDLKPEDTLYVLGDVIDRGPESMPILQEIMRSSNIEMFVGNHELMMLDHLDRTGDPTNWFLGNNGGRKTLAEYRKLPENERKEILDFLHESYVQKFVEVDGVKYALSHSLTIPGYDGIDLKYKDANNDDVFIAVWFSPYRIIEYMPEAVYKDEYVHIIGHVPVQLVPEGPDKPPLYGREIGEHLIDIDGGCARIAFGKPGGLYCMSLEKEENGKRKEFWITPED